MEANKAFAVPDRRDVAPIEELPLCFAIGVLTIYSNGRAGANGRIQRLDNSEGQSNDKTQEADPRGSASCRHVLRARGLDYCRSNSVVRSAVLFPKPSLA